MKVEVLISAMNLNDFSIFGRTHCVTDTLIINQTDYEGYDERIIDGHKVRMYSTTQRGLSRSRNMALAHAIGDYCILADDDEVLCENYDKLIIDVFNRNQDADAIAFNYYDPNVRLQNSKRKIIQKEGEAPKSKSFSSVCLVFKRERILRKGIWFNINLGAGSGMISAGEESAWEYDLRCKGLRLFQCTDYITEVRTQSSTWFNGYNEKYFYDLGANLEVKYGWIKYIYQFYYPIRLHKESTLSFFQQLRFIYVGMQGFRKGLSYQQYINLKNEL